MATVIGPNRYLPGQSYPFNADCRICDSEDCEAEARHAVILETDSFGSEVEHLCTDCFLKFQAALAEDRASTKICDVCHEPHTDIEPMRDPDEGTCGRVYDVCSNCRHTFLALFDDSDDEDYESGDGVFDTNPSSFQLNRRSR